MYTRGTRLVVAYFDTFMQVCNVRTITIFSLVTIAFQHRIVTSLALLLWVTFKWFEPNAYRIHFEQILLPFDKVQEIRFQKQRVKLHKRQIHLHLQRYVHSYMYLSLHCSFPPNGDNKLTFHKANTMQTRNQLFVAIYLR